MSTTVYEELSHEIRMFAKEHNLKVVFDPIDKDNPDIWGFTLYNQSRSWDIDGYYPHSNLRC